MNQPNRWTPDQQREAAAAVRLALEERRRPNGTDVATLGNCSNCNGTGKIIYMDKGKVKSIPCGACTGTGQTK